MAYNQIYFLFSETKVVQLDNEIKGRLKKIYEQIQKKTHNLIVKENQIKM